MVFSWLPAVNVCNYLHILMKYGCTVYNALFLKILKAVEHSREDKSKDLHSVVCQRQYSSFGLQGCQTWWEIQLGLMNMSSFLQVGFTLMGLKEYGHVFCAGLNFDTCTDLLVVKIEEIIKKNNFWSVRSLFARELPFWKWKERRGFTCRLPRSKTVKI